MSQINQTKSHKRVSTARNRITNSKKRGVTIFEELSRKITDLYHMPFQTIASVFNLIN